MDLEDKIFYSVVVYLISAQVGLLCLLVYRAFSWGGSVVDLKFKLLELTNRKEELTDWLSDIEVEIEQIKTQIAKEDKTIRRSDFIVTMKILLEKMNDYTVSSYTTYLVLDM